MKMAKLLSIPDFKIGALKSNFLINPVQEVSFLPGAVTALSPCHLNDSFRLVDRLSGGIRVWKCRKNFVSRPERDLVCKDDGPGYEGWFIGRVTFRDREGVPLRNMPLEEEINEIIHFFPEFRREARQLFSDTFHGHATILL